MKINILFLLLILALSLLSVSAHAQEYILELQQIEATDEAQLKPKIPNDRLAELENKGFTILSTNEKSTEFYFHIDRTAVSFADLTEGGSFIEHINTQVQSETGVHYQILTKLLSSFSSVSDQTIEPTTCDDGCSVRVAKPWKSEDVYGWGYSVDEGDTYRPFSQESVGSIVPMTSSKSKSEMILKVQTPPNQPEGNFQGIVQLIALPEL